MAHTAVTAHQWGQIFSKAWLDHSFADLLRTDPTAAVRQFLKVPAGTQIDIFMVPPRPADYTDDQLQAVVHGSANIQMPYCC